MKAVEKRKFLQPEMVARLNSMGLRARLVVEGYLIGQHKSPYHGFSVEFADHMAYNPGDDIRYVDWKLFGKTDRYYIKRFEEETNLRSFILMDTSKSMAYTSGAVKTGLLQLSGSSPFLSDGTAKGWRWAGPV